MPDGCRPASGPSFTPKQGQYLAFIHAYTLVIGRPPAEADMQRHFRVTPPSVHQMVLTLERAASSGDSPASPAASKYWSNPKPCRPKPQPRSNRQILCAEVLARNGSCR